MDMEKYINPDGKITDHVRVRSCIFKYNGCPFLILCSENRLLLVNVQFQTGYVNILFGGNVYRFRLNFGWWLDQGFKSLLFIK